LYGVFGRFVRRGVKKHEVKNQKSIRAHQNKMELSFLRFFSPSFLLLDFFIEFLNVSCQRWLKKRDEKIAEESPKKIPG
jgi:hypothetical protein